MDCFVSVIVPVWNDARRVERCIAALENQSIDRSHYEIIIADNGSEDGTFEFLNSLKNIILVRESTPGSYAARNKALEVAKGTIVAFTDADCIPDRDWLSEHLALINSTANIGVSAGKIDFYTDSKGKIESEAILYEKVFSMDQSLYANKGVCITANWASYRSTIEQFGGFDTSLKSGGDHALSKSLSEKGRVVLYNERALVLHPVRDVKEILIKRRRVIGGAWDSSTQSMKFLRATVDASKLLTKRCFLVLRNEEYKITSKLLLISLLFKIYVTSLDELMKLQLGKPSNRA